MKECCETEGPKKKRYWHWIVLGGVVVLAIALQMIPDRHTYFVNDSSRPQADIAALMAALDEYGINNNGAYPSSLKPLVTPDTNGNAYLEGYDNKVPLDPWKHEYQYAPPTPEHPRPHVWSFGADGKVGGSGADKDIHSDS